MHRRFPRCIFFALTMAVLAAALRLWADLDQATLLVRHPHIGHGVLWYRPPGQSLGFALNMPVAILCNRAFASPLELGFLRNQGWKIWVGEGFVVSAQALLTGLFWWGIAILLRGTSIRERRHAPWILAASALLPVLIMVLAVVLAIEGWKGLHSFLQVSPSPSTWFHYISDSSLVDPLLGSTCGLWCAGIASLFIWKLARPQFGKG